MEICKAPTLRLKALNKHTHIMYIEMENVIPKINMYVYRQVFEHNMQNMHAHARTHARTHAHTHTHTHTHTLKYSEKRNALSWPLKEERVAECLMSWGRLFQIQSALFVHFKIELKQLTSKHAVLTDYVHKLLSASAPTPLTPPPPPTHTHQNKLWIDTFGATSFM